MSQPQNERPEQMTGDVKSDPNFKDACLARATSKIADLQAQLAMARRRPLRVTRDFIIYHLLKLASKSTALIDGRRAYRFANSAEKFSPARDLTVQSSYTKSRYRDWVKSNDTIRPRDRRAITKHIGQLTHRPLLSVVMPVYETPPKLLRQALESVCSQLYPNWELCIADDASPSPHIASILAEFAKRDSRIKWIRRDKNGNISEATNSALALASGEFVAFMDHDDLLAEQALYEVAVEISSHPDADLIYSDEDCINDAGKRFSPHFKTDWNPELFLCYNMISHLGVYRRTIIERIGGCRPGFEGSQDYDLALRFSRETVPSKIRHIPSVLYHWRRSSEQTSFSQTKIDRCLAAARLSKTQHLAALGQTAHVDAHPLLRHWDWVRRTLPTALPLVSIIIPTRNKADLLRRCLEGVLNKTNYDNFEVIVIDHQSDQSEAIELLRLYSRDSRVKIMPYSGEFNYSDMNNKAVSLASGTLLAFLNNDVEVINPDWLSEMVALAVIETYGVVGAKLLYADTTVQHCGVLLLPDGGGGHLFGKIEANDPGYFGRAVLPSNLSAVTGACIVLRKSVFVDVGGFNSVDLKVSYNDIDLCLKVAARGFFNVWTPRALLYHHEMQSRGRDGTPEKRAQSKSEADYMRRTWGSIMQADPFYNLNFLLRGSSCKLDYFSRRIKPWMAVNRTE